MQASELLQEQQYLVAREALEPVSWVEVTKAKLLQLVPHLEVLHQKRRKKAHSVLSKERESHLVLTLKTHVARAVLLPHRPKKPQPQKLRPLRTKNKNKRET
jgi:hypothetical protein